MNFFILALLGYFLMILSKGEHLITINKSKTLLVIGVGLCLLSYILIFIKFIKEYNHIEMKNKISYGNLILFGVYCFNLFIPLIEHKSSFNIIILLAHLLLIKKNKYNIIGYLFMAIYYSFIIYHIISLTKSECLELCGAALLVIFYVYEFYHKYITKSKKMNKKDE